MIQINKLYPDLNIERLEQLGSGGGFSGAELWKCHSNSTTLNETYCLRHWPADHPNDTHLAWIHRVICHAYAQGCHFLAVPFSNSRGETISRCQSGESSEPAAARWELTHWMPGVADFSSNPNATRLRDMMRSLAQFHQASAQVTLDFHTSQNLGRRVEQLRQFLHRDYWSQIADLRTGNRSWIKADLNRELDELVHLFYQHAPRLVKRLLAELPTSSPGGASLSALSVLPLQPILRDIWHDHVLFSGDEVTGMIDYGAMQVDNIAFDIARLLGTTVADDQASWEFGLAAYEETRHLSAVERTLIPWIDRSGIVLGSLNWLRWLLIEQRRFADWESVARRLEFLKRRLCYMVSDFAR